MLSKAKTQRSSIFKTFQLLVKTITVINDCDSFMWLKWNGSGKIVSKLLFYILSLAKQSEGSASLHSSPNI